MLVTALWRTPSMRHSVAYTPSFGTTTSSGILDFDGDLYGKHMTVLFHKFLRPERKFASLEELKAQIQKDAGQTKQLLP